MKVIYNSYLLSIDMGGLMDVLNIVPSSVFFREFHYVI